VNRDQVILTILAAVIIAVIYTIALPLVILRGIADGLWDWLSALEESTREAIDAVREAGKP
jgi:hypothetical protein